MGLRLLARPVSVPGHASRWPHDTRHRGQLLERCGWLPGVVPIPWWWCGLPRGGGLHVPGGRAVHVGGDCRVRRGWLVGVVHPLLQVVGDAVTSPCGGRPAGCCVVPNGAPADADGNRIRDGDVDGHCSVNTVVHRKCHRVAAAIKVSNNVASGHRVWNPFPRGINHTCSECVACGNCNRCGHAWGNG